MKRLIVLISSTILLSCGAVKKDITKNSRVEDTTLEILDLEKTKSDSSERKEAKSEAKSDTKSEYLSEAEDVDIILSPKVIDTTSKAKSEVVKVKTPKGTYEYEIPKNYDFRFTTKSVKEAKTENSKNESKAEEKVDKKSSESKDVSRETKVEQKKKSKDVTKAIKKSEPIAFNIGFWVVVLILIGGIVLYVKIKY